MPNRSALVVLLAVLLAGCSDSPARKKVYPVEGKLTFNTEPMAGAMVTFHPAGDADPRALRAQATAAADGSYKLTAYVSGDGAPAGEYVVTVYWPGKRAGKPKGPDEEETDMPPDRLNRRYAVAATTKLRATVRESPNTIDFTLP
jgi:hypothetical protein